MSAELTAAPAGSTREPWDWYVEQPWVTHRLLDVADIDPRATFFDPCCGAGNIVRALTERGHTAFGMDILDRGAPNFLGTHDFIGPDRVPIGASPNLSIIFNPPYSYQNGRKQQALAERFIRRALLVANCQVAALLPLKWLASAGRVRLFTDPATRPSAIYILGERPSMPPGNQIEAMGEAAFSGGKVDYMWMLWNLRAQRPDPAAGVPSYWIPPRPKPPRRRA